MKDFIFGTLATEELRHKHVRDRLAGVSHANARSPRDPIPGETVRLLLSVGPSYACDQAWIYWTNDGTDPIGKHGIATNGFSIPMQSYDVKWDTVLWGYFKVFEASIQGQSADTIVRYCLSITTSDGKETFADGGTIYAFYIDNDPVPVWTQDAIIYQIFVDRFFPGEGKAWLTPESLSGFYGGTLKGILEKFDYLSELGVNTLWLTPIFSSPSHHGYDATDLFTIEPRLGNKSDLRNLLDEAHQRNTRILLDLVPNHVSNLHPSFQAARHDKNSPYRDWYSFEHWPDKYQSFFGVRSLPQLNLRNPAAKQHILDAVAYWLDFGIDGYRVDYAIGPAADFWADFRQTTRKTRPDSWTFAEVVEPPDSQLNFFGGLDGCLDFNLMEAFRSAFAYSDWNGDDFSSFLNRHEDYFPEGYSRPSFIDNHDMNRFLWAANGNKQRLRLASLCQFTLSGPPVIYYGTEVGLSQLRDVRQENHGKPEESRLPMLWGKEQDLQLFDYYKDLIHLRMDYKPLRHGKASKITSDESLFMYTKGEKNDILVALNLSQNSCNISLSENYPRVVFRTGDSNNEIKGNSLKLDPFGGIVLTKK